LSPRSIRFVASSIFARARSALLLAAVARAVSAAIGSTGFDDDDDSSALQARMKPSLLVKPSTRSISRPSSPITIAVGTKSTRKRAANAGSSDDDDAGACHTIVVLPKSRSHVLQGASSNNSNAGCFCAFDNANASSTLELANAVRATTTIDTFTPSETRG